MAEKTSNFKEILARAGIAGNVVSGHCLLQGEQPGDSSPKEMTPRDIEKALDALYWSTQKQFIDELTTSKKQSEVQAMLLLKYKVKEKYGATKTPFLIFAQDLAAEEQQLKDLLTTLLRVSNTSKMSARDKSNHISLLKKLYDQRQQQAHNLENLIQITNTLLM
jgi:phage gp16-like protein